ncbi:unnamed protein product [Cuscuta epithymum]|nr:unnamed protein product [Cuscuta epithymum]
MKEMIIKCDNMILEGEEEDLLLDEEVKGEKEAPNRSLRAKEDKEVMIRPPPEPPPWRNCASRVVGDRWRFLVKIRMHLNFHVFAIFVFFYFRSNYVCFFYCCFVLPDSDIR